MTFLNPFKKKRFEYRRYYLEDDDVFSTVNKYFDEVNILLQFVVPESKQENLGKLLEEKQREAWRKLWDLRRTKDELIDKGTI